MPGGWGPTPSSPSTVRRWRVAPVQRSCGLLVGGSFRDDLDQSPQFDPAHPEKPTHLPFLTRPVCLGLLLHLPGRREPHKEVVPAGRTVYTGRYNISR